RSLADERATQLEHVSEFQAEMLQKIDPADAGLKLMRDIEKRHAAALDARHVVEEERPAKVRALAEELARVNATDTAVEIIEDTILAPAVVAVEKQFADQPIVDARLRQTLGTLYLKLGLYDKARPLMQSALNTRRRVLGEEHADTLLSLNNMGDLLDNQGKFADAEPFYRSAFEGRRRALGAEHAETLSSM